MTQEFSDQDVVQIIHDLLYKEQDREGCPVYNKDREWPPDLIEQIAHFVAKRIPRPGEELPKPERKEGDPLLTSEEYVMHEGCRCPNCGKEDGVESNSRVQTDASIAWQECYCTKCGAEWNDLYDLTGYDELQLQQK